MTIDLLNANALHIPLADESVQMCMTSPPYWALRDYGVAGQLGNEATPEEYVADMVAVFREVRRVLKPDGVLWLNLGDSYAGSGGAGGDYNEGGLKAGQPRFEGTAKKFRPGAGRADGIVDERGQRNRNGAGGVPGLKPKDLCGIPWRVSFALQADGWWLRSDIIWHKPNPMPESVTDRPTKAHEYLFLLAKSADYFYDAEAIKEAVTDSTIERLTQPNLPNQVGSTRVPGKANGNMKAVGKAYSFARSVSEEPPPGQPNQHRPDREDIEYRGTRNRRTVWTIPTSPYKGAHFATFPPALVEPCVLAGTSARGECPHCGKAWMRVTERTKYTPEVVEVGERNVDESRGDKTRKLSGKEYNEQVSSITTGWRPQCDCYPRTREWIEYIRPSPGEELTPDEIKDNENRTILREELLDLWATMETNQQLVIDPFTGTATVGLVSVKLQRRFVGLELNPAYMELAKERLYGTQIQFVM